MDPVQPQASTPNQAHPPMPPQNPTPLEEQRKQLIPLFIIAIVLLICMVGVGAFLFRNISSRTQTPQSSPTPQPSSSPEPSVSVSQEGTSPTPLVSSAPTAVSSKVSAGMQTQTFTSYTLTLMPGWTPAHQTDAAAQTDTLLVTKNGSSLTILQAAGSAGACVFPDDSPQSQAQTFTSYVDIPGTSPQLRRGVNQDGTYTVCERKSGGFAFPTSYGYITYKLADAVDQTTLTEVDKMVATITKQ
jgi:hypothetical protein